MTQEVQPRSAKRSTPRSAPRQAPPAWAAFSIALNGLLLLGISLVAWKPHLLSLLPIRSLAPAPETVASPSPSPTAPEATGDRKQLTYDQWLDILKKEAAAAAKDTPDRLTVLLGDSLSLWFPPELLPSDRSWLNQGISGENSAGLFKRVNLLDDTKPQTVFVMVGINDLIKGVPESQLLENLRQTVQALKQKHPKTEIVLQSLLPHGNDRTTAEDREALLKISNDQIFKLNQKIAAIAKDEQVFFLNLYPLFVNSDGWLRPELTTDGLHLSRQGYDVWRTAMTVFSQTQLAPPAPKPASDTPSKDEPAPETHSSAPESSKTDTPSPSASTSSAPPASSGDRSESGGSAAAPSDRPQER